MKVDRKVHGGLNAVLGTIVVLAIGGMAWAALHASEGGSSSPSPIVDQKLRRIQQEAYSAERTESLKTAEARYREAIQEKPQKREFQEGLARVLAAQGRSREAWPILRDLVESGANSPDALAWYIDLGRQFGDPNKCRIAFSSLTKKKPPAGILTDKDLVIPHLLAAQAAALKMTFEWSHVRRAIALDPTSLSAELALSEQQFNAGMTSEAKKSYEKAKGLLRSDSAEDWLRMARFDIRHAPPAQTLQDFRNAERAPGVRNAAYWVKHLEAFRSFRIDKHRFDAKLTDRTDAAVTALSFGPDLDTAINIANLMYILGHQKAAVSMVEKLLLTASGENRPRLEEKLRELRRPHSYPGDWSPPPVDFPID